MSGTGNTYRMACQMKEMANPYLEDIKIVMIDEADAEDEPAHSRATLVGILFPTHGFMPPWSMIKFLLRMRRQNGVPALCAATRGGIKVGPLRIPTSSFRIQTSLLSTPCPLPYALCPQPHAFVIPHPEFKRLGPLKSLLQRQVRSSFSISISILSRQVLIFSSEFSRTTGI